MCVCKASVWCTITHLLNSKIPKPELSMFHVEEGKKGLQQTQEGRDGRSRTGDGS